MLPHIFAIHNQWLTNSILSSLGKAPLSQPLYGTMSLTPMSSFSSRVQFHTALVLVYLCFQKNPVSEWSDQWLPTATLNIPIVSFIIAHSLSLTIVPCFCIIRSDSVQYSKAALTYAWSPFFVAESAEKIVFLWYRFSLVTRKLSLSEFRSFGLCFVTIMWYLKTITNLLGCSIIQSDTGTDYSISFLRFSKWKRFTFHVGKTS